jgi:hypothetical protein
MLPLLEPGLHERDTQAAFGGQELELAGVLS